MTRFFPLLDAGDEFLQTARSRVTRTFEVPRPADAVWRDLTSADTLSWCRVVDSVTWDSDRPFGVGTTRGLRLAKGAASVRERYFRWDEGHRKSFAVIEASAPVFRRFAEDYVVEPTGPASSQFTWTIAIEMKPGLRPAAAINRLLIRTLFRDTAAHFGAS